MDGGDPATWAFTSCTPWSALTGSWSPGCTSHVHTLLLHSGTLPGPLTLSSLPTPSTTNLYFLIAFLLLLSVLVFGPVKYVKFWHDFYRWYPTSSELFWGKRHKRNNLLRTCQYHTLRRRKLGFFAYTKVARDFSLSGLRSGMYGKNRINAN